MCHRKTQDIFFISRPNVPKNAVSGVSKPKMVIICKKHCEILERTYVTLDHKTSLKSLEYICSNGQKYTVSIKIIDFSFIPKIIRILIIDHVP